jgi:hypothetical protein
MRRREFITLLGGAAAWPLTLHAQQPDRVMRIGVLGPRPENTGISGGVAAGYPAMLDELRKLGFSEGRNLTIRISDGRAGSPRDLCRCGGIGALERQRARRYRPRSRGAGRSGGK